MYIYTRYSIVFQAIFLWEKMKDLFTARQALGNEARSDRAQKGKPMAGKRVGAMTQK